MDAILKLLMENPGTLTPVIKEYVNKYKPIAYSIAGELFGIFTDLTKNKEYYKTIAKHKKNLYSAYINAGFTEEQAIAFILNDNLQLVKNLNSISNSGKQIANNIDN